ncbi:proteasome maturation protein [Chrysoperla carnea]|uniref:proteasome maturation protein n=1 Tax=Chrysoperla carnea TaxID=189513 RepID=UPI001D06D3E3|nr:proteasome maturation protein [Chrysoperla carnea]
MSFGLPSLKPKGYGPENLGISEGFLGVPEVMVHGAKGARAAVEPVHPLQHALATATRHQNQLNMAILRSTQGLHAPLRIAMELKAVNQTGHLPFLPSTNVLRDSLTGRDLEIGFEDIFNTGEFREQLIQPHAMVEKKLNLI